MTCQNRKYGGILKKLDLDLFYRTNPAQGPTWIELEKNTTFRLRFHLHRAPTREFQ